MKASLWKIGTRRAMAYVEGREALERLAVVAGVERAPLKRGAGIEAELQGPGAVAVYTDPKGRPFAWLIAFDAKRWDDVSALAAS
ncbi:hypothetical protein [Armatimonas rosea]|uniref:Uncharacterized protein n=1 Tax=Armatimonas rosea TaxID=685828 RepID=A0A7W9SS89_ARMRO|nr:hypothetical protein [Armatimonas rosea]MBB6051877.1 hypothetical protein [Armatimonas rosea]